MQYRDDKDSIIKNLQNEIESLNKTIEKFREELGRVLNAFSMDVIQIELDPGSSNNAMKYNVTLRSSYNGTLVMKNLEMKNAWDFQVGKSYLVKVSKYG